MKFKLLFVLFALVATTFAVSGDCSKFGYNNTTTVCLGGTTGNGTFNGNVSASSFLGNISWTYLTNIPFFNNLSLTDIVSSIGNWSLDKPNYYNKTSSDARYPVNISLGFGFNGTGTLLSANQSLNINSSIFQRRAAASCTTGIGYIDEDGTIHCSASQTIGFYNASQVDALGNLTNYYNKTSTPVYNNGTVTSIIAGSGLTGGTITGSGTIALNTSALPVYNNGTSNLTMTDVVNGVGNWSNDKPSYPATSTLAGLLGNWSADKGSYTNTAGIATLMGNSTIARTGASSACTYGIANATTTTIGVSVTCAAQQGTLTTETDPVWSGVSGSVARTGTATCPSGQVAQNITTTTGGITSQCVIATAAGGGNVTATNATANYVPFFTNSTNVANGRIYWNGTCLIQQGSTSTFNIC